MLGYHFVGVTLKNGEPVPPDGEWLVRVGPIEPCVSGLHMSERPFQALQYAPGSTICRVELDGELVPHDEPIDKWVGRRRRIIGRADATEMLRRFAADQALSVSHLWDMPTVVRDYLETLDESTRVHAETAAEAAARDVWAARVVVASEKSAEAWDAAWAGAWAVAGMVPWSVPRNAWAVRAAVRAAVAVPWDAARDTTRAATWAMATVEAVNAWSAESAAAAVAWDAAWLGVGGDTAAAPGIDFDLRVAKLFTKG